LQFGELFFIQFSAENELFAVRATPHIENAHSYKGARQRNAHVRGSCPTNCRIGRENYTFCPTMILMKITALPRTPSWISEAYF